MLNKENKLIDMIPETRELFNQIDQVDAEKLDRDQSIHFGRKMGEIQVTVSGFLIDYVMFWKLLELFLGMAVSLLIAKIWFSGNLSVALTAYAVWFFFSAIVNVINLHKSRSLVVTTASELTKQLKSFPRKN